nr:MULTISPECIES: hypothetical protein [unclassified Bradyrhizobium]
MRCLIFLRLTIIHRCRKAARTRRHPKHSNSSQIAAIAATIAVSSVVAGKAS